MLNVEIMAAKSFCFNLSKLFCKEGAKKLFNPLPLLFKSLLHGQKNRDFSAGI
jgi:hypothetical protein